MRTSVFSVATNHRDTENTDVQRRNRELLVAGRACALHIKVAESRDDCVAVSDKLLPGWTKRRILVELVSGDHIVDLLLKVSDLRDRVAELALIERQRNAIELAQKAGAILCFGVLAGDIDDLNFTLELGDHGLDFADRRSESQRSSDEHSECK